MRTEQVRIAKFEAKILLLMNKVAELEARNALLEKELLYYYTKKGGKNSSMQAMSSDIFRFPISSGNLVDVIQSFVDKCTNIYEYIRQQIIWLAVVGNNVPEKTIPTFNIKQKVSGLLHSTAGAAIFTITHSVIGTTIKNAQNVKNELMIVPLMPTELLLFYIFAKNTNLCENKTCR